MNAFLAPVRAGVKAPPKIIATVLTALRARLRERGGWDHAADLQPLRQAIVAIIGHPTEALALAQEALDHEALPPEERAMRKEAQAADARRQWMEAQPPTERQVAYLRVLGHAGEVRSRAEASDLIEQLKRGRRA